MMKFKFDPNQKFQIDAIISILDIFEGQGRNSHSPVNSPDDFFLGIYPNKLELDEETIRQNFDFIDEYISTKDMVHMTIGLRIYPDTRLFKIALRDKIITEGQTLLKPVFYISPEIGKGRLTEIIKIEAAKRHHCVTASESTPSSEMLQQALEMQRKENIQEPMFRSLLRVRKEMMESGKL